MREPFEVNDQKLGCFVYLHLLERRYMLLTLSAIPLVASSQCFFLREASQAVINRNVLGVLSKPILSEFVNIVRPCIEVNLLESRVVECFEIHFGSGLPVDGQIKLSVVLHEVQNAIKSNIIIKDEEAIVLVSLPTEITTVDFSKHTLFLW